EDDGDARPRERTAATIAKARQQASVGMLTDALGDESFCHALVEAIGDGGEFATALGRLRFVPTGSYAALAGAAPGKLPVSAPIAQSSNTAVTLGERLFLKCYRRLRRGINPEFEIGCFLTNVARFPNCVPVAGGVEHVAADGSTSALAVLQAYVSNQGDGWNYTLEYLDRHFADTGSAGEGTHGPYLALSRTLGERVAQLHRAFATPGGGADFDPEPVTERDVAAWKARARAEAQATLELLSRRAGVLDDVVRHEAGMLLANRRGLLATIDGAVIATKGMCKLRYHGGLHLGRVLLRNNDFLIIDFEGETACAPEERRAKHSPLRDVAGLLRSFDYARWSALRRPPHGAQEYARCAPLADAWHTAARQAFLEGYAQAVEGAGILASLEAARGLVRLFEIEKALCELRQELENRPAWAAIPLNGLRALAG
ncbi:MAG TPA: alpha-amylase, partial [Usitatibacteraceae bacterium]|nr:alpha-amylase [Usitatibacteraceae bacterium]